MAAEPIISEGQPVWAQAFVLANSEVFGWADWHMSCHRYFDMPIKIAIITCLHKQDSMRESRRWAPVCEISAEVRLQLLLYRCDGSAVA